MSTPHDALDYPRQQARTRRFTLGVPRDVTIAPDGRILFLRTPAGDDPVTALWELTPPGDGPSQERCLVDPRTLDGDDADLPAEERARRERTRELAGGITGYAVDREAAVVAFALGGRLHTVDVGTGTVVEQPAAGAVYDPRPAPDGRAVAYVADDGVHVLELRSGPSAAGIVRPLVVEEGVSWGRAEFIAAEEMGRTRGLWWSPDGQRLAVARVDEREVPMWHLADPAAPWVPPVPQRYPAAGTTNADVRLAVFDLDGARRVDAAWDRDRLPYLARVRWEGGPLTLQVLSRDQRRSEILVVDTGTGAVTTVRVLEDDAWVEPVPGVPAWSGSRLVTVEDRADHGPDGSRALVVDGEVVTPAGLQVRAVAHVDERQVVLTASGDDPTRVQAYTWTDAGLEGPLDDRPGVHGVVAGPAAHVTARAAVDGQPPEVVGRWPGHHQRLHVAAAAPVVTPRPQRLELGPRGLRAVLLLPTTPANGPLPVVLDPYGGPHAQRVLEADGPLLTSQWLADQGFAVLVADGRGTPGRGPRWEREVAGDLATGVLEDQIEALHAAAALEPRLDVSRVGIRGWSFGGYLAAMAVLRRPDVFRAAVAGAPVTDWRLYDTHYTERYLGNPDEQPTAYRTSSLVDVDGRLLDAAPWDADAPPALLLVHGLADDNVVAAHTLRLSAALLADGRPHTFLPLSGVTHVAAEEDIAERLLTLQAGFLHHALR